MLPRDQTREFVLEKIAAAQQAGISLYINGLVHNYSILGRDSQYGKYYQPNPEWETGERLTGCRILGEKEMLRLLRPQTVLLEGKTPDWKYVPQDSKHDFTPFLSSSLYTSPNLNEIVREVNRQDIVVRGCDISYDDREEIRELLGFPKYYDLAKDFSALLRWMQRAKSLSSQEHLAVRTHLAHDRSAKDLSDPNNFYTICTSIDQTLARLRPGTVAPFAWFLDFFSEAKNVFREYIQFR